VVITPGQRHDSTQLGPVLAGIRVPRPEGRGRPRTRPERVIADKGYSYAHCRQLLRQRQIPHTIPERRDQRARRATRRGRPLAFEKAIYTRRNVVERCINRLKHWRGLATRYEKRGQLPRAGGHRVHRHLARLVMCQTDPRARVIATEPAETHHETNPDHHCGRWYAFDKDH
jgi:transposase